MRKLLLALSVITALNVIAGTAQQPSTLANMPPASVPLSGAELVYVVQGGVSKKVSVSALANAIPVVPSVIVTASTTLAVAANTGLNRTVGVAAMVANLPAVPIGQPLVIDDLACNLQAFPVTVTPPAGQTIVGRATYVMNEDCQSATFRYFGSNIWGVE